MDLFEIISSVVLPAILLSLSYIRIPSGWRWGDPDDPIARHMREMEEDGLEVGVLGGRVHGVFNIMLLA